MPTSNHAVISPRCLTLVSAVALLFLSDRLMWVHAIGVYAFTLAMLLAMPRYRSTDLINVVLLLVTAQAFVSGFKTGKVDGVQFLSSMAAIGAALAPIKVIRIRHAAARDGHHPPPGFDRRVQPERASRPMSATQPNTIQRYGTADSGGSR